MPWIPELFSAPALERVLADRRHARVPFFAGMMAGEIDALVGSFAGEPELHHPVRGRVKGRGAFERFAADMGAWLVERNVEVEDIALTITPRRGVEEVVLHFDGDDGTRMALPVAIATDHPEGPQLEEMRLYFSTWPLTGGHALRPPLLQPDPGVGEADVVGEYQRALAAGDLEGVLATFEPGAHVREPAGGPHRHPGADALPARPPRRPSSPPPTPAGPPAGPTSTGAPTSCARCSRGSSPTAAASPWSTAPPPTTAAPARWSTTSSRGAARPCRPRPASPSTSAARAAGWPPRGSTTTPTRR